MLSSYGRKVVAPVLRPSGGGVVLALSRLLKIEEDSLMSRLERGETLIAIARERGVGRHRVRATLAHYMPGVAASKLVARHTMGEEVFQQLLRYRPARKTTPRPPKLKGHPKGA